MNLSELILNYLKEHSLSQRQFAARCNLSAGYVSLIVKEINPQTGKRMVPTLHVLNKLATGMGLSLDELLASCDDMDVSLSSSFDSAPDSRDLFLTAHEQKLIVAYRSHPEMQAAVDRLLDITAEELEFSQRNA